MDAVTVCQPDLQVRFDDICDFGDEWTAAIARAGDMEEGSPSSREEEPTSWT
jgi:hypothetical protein